MVSRKIYDPCRSNMCVLVMFLVSWLFGSVACKIGLGFCSEFGLKVLNVALAAFNVGR